MKKCITAVLSLSLILNMAFVYSDTIDTISEDINTQTIKISGNGLTPMDTVLIRLDDSESGNIEVLIPVTVDANGAYSIDFRLDNGAADSGKKNITVKPQFGSAAKSVLQYYSTADVNALISSWNDYTTNDKTEDMAVLVNSEESISMILHSDLSAKLSSALAAKDKTELAVKLCACENADSIDMISSQFLPIYINFVVNNADDALKTEVIGEFINTFISKETDVYKEVYLKLSDEKKQSVCSVAAKKIGLKTSMLTNNEIGGIITEEVLINGLKGINYYAEVYDYLEKFNDFFGLDFSRYNTINDTYSVTTAIINNPSEYSSYNTLKTYFDNLISKIYTSPKPKPGGGGSSGSAAGIPTYVRTDDETVNEVIEEVIFDDIADFDWAKESIMSLYNVGVIDGVGGKSFLPARYITREEFVKLVLAVVNTDDFETVDCDFTDADKDEWYWNYLSLAKSAGIISGRDDKTFGIGENITRQDMAVICINAITLKKQSLFKDITLSRLQFSDADDISEYALYAVTALNKLGIVKGFDDNRFMPGSFATRAEAAVMVSRVLEL